jgi:hypothetical protein
MGTSGQHRFTVGAQVLVRMILPDRRPFALEEDANWDLVELYVDDDQYMESEAIGPSGADVLRVLLPAGTSKFAGTKMLRETGKLLGYERYMLADDDVLPVGCTWRSIFEAFAWSRYEVGQPAATRDSFVAERFTFQEDLTRYRTTNFVDGTCPIFTRAALERYLPIFDGTKTGMGLEEVWSWRESATGRPCVVLDGTPVRHDRPLALDLLAEAATGAFLREQRVRPGPRLVHDRMLR